MRRALADLTRAGRAWLLGNLGHAIAALDGRVDDLERRDAATERELADVRALVTELRGDLAEPRPSALAVAEAGHRRRHRTELEA